MTPEHAETGTAGANPLGISPVPGSWHHMWWARGLGLFVHFDNIPPLHQKMTFC